MCPTARAVPSLFQRRPDVTAALWVSLRRALGRSGSLTAKHAGALLAYARGDASLPVRTLGRDDGVAPRMAGPCTASGGGRVRRPAGRRPPGRVPAATGRAV